MITGFFFPICFSSLVYLEGLETCLAHVYSAVFVEEKKEERKKKKERKETQMLANFSMQTIHLHLTFLWWTWFPIFERYFFFSTQILPKDKSNIRCALLTKPFENMLQ